MRNIVLIGLMCIISFVVGYSLSGNKLPENTVQAATIPSNSSGCLTDCMFDAAMYLITLENSYLNQIDFYVPSCPNGYNAECVTAYRVIYKQQILDTTENTKEAVLNAVRQCCISKCDYGYTGDCLSPIFDSLKEAYELSLQQYLSSIQNCCNPAN